MKLKIALIRHGETEEAAVEHLVADNDGPLSENGKKAIQEKCAAKAYPKLRHVYSCELMCCRDTAALIYPFPAVILKELNMRDPIAFDGEVIRGSLSKKVPLNIEALYDIGAKAGNIVRKISAELEIKKTEQCALISRKMIIFEILRRYCVPRSNYEDWEIPFGGGYLIEYDTVEETAKVLGSF